MWEAKDSERSMRWGEYDDWRMPTLKELATLYDKIKEYRIILSKVYVTELSCLSDKKVFASDNIKPKGDANFTFTNGVEHSTRTRIMK
jgi:hypothetical protein